MHVYIERSDEHKELSFSGSAKNLCKELEVNPQTVLILRNDELVTEDEELVDEDNIKLITVVSGG